MLQPSHVFGIVALLLSAVVSAQGVPASVSCNELGELLSAPAGRGIDKFIPKTTAERGILRFLDLDFDKDGRPDAVAIGCPAALASQKQCVLDAQKSSGGGYSLQETNLFVISYKGQVFAISSERGPARKVGAGKVLRLTANGIQSVCTGL